MSCPPPDRVLDYIARRLDAREREQLDAHVDTCAACRALLAELARTDPDAIVELAPADDPTAIGRYQVTARIGDGGMGTVYAAYDPQLDRKVAVKLVHPELAARGGMERLLREGRALARLSHPNVVAVHDAGTDGDRVYIAMELVEGETLATWLRTPRTWRMITQMFVAAGRGIAAAHRSGIVHRDIKPENVLIDRDGRPKVADFGLAETATTSGTVTGTPAFMSPEQRAGSAVGPATDQYSLCAALVFALDGHRVPRWLHRAIARGMAAEAGERFRSIDDLVAALDPERHARRRRWITAAAIAAVTLAAGSIAYAATREPDEVAIACDRATAQRIGLWTAADRHAVASALLATNVPYAAETWPRVDAALAGYLDDLAAAQASMCSQRPNSAETAAAFDQAMMCLAEKRLQLGNLTTQLRTIAPGDVRFAVEAAHTLDPVEDCANAPVLAAEHAARSTPLGFAKRIATVIEFTAARQALDAGNYLQASAHAKQGIAYARSFGGVILAKALLAYVDICSVFEPTEAVEAAAREAATVAETAHADTVRAVALAELMQVISAQPGREKAALELQPLVAAAIARSGAHSSIEPMMLQAAGVAQMRLGDSDAAIESFSAALDAARRALPPRDPRLPEYIYPLGVALGMVRRDAEAARYHAEAYRVASEIWGPNHPNAVRYEINLAVKHGALGDCTTSLREAKHARAILSDLLPAASPEHLLITEIIGTCYYYQHDDDAAMREHLARQAALRTGGQEHGAEMANVWIDIGDVQLDRKQVADAIASYRTAVGELEGVVGLADPRLAYPLGRLGEAELAANQREHALATLERAAAVSARAPALLAADVNFPLARAVWPADRARARALATAARDAWRTGGAQFADKATAADAWLRDH